MFENDMLFAIEVSAAGLAAIICLYFAAKDEIARRAGLSDDEAAQEWEESQW